MAFSLARNAWLQAMWLDSYGWLVIHGCTWGLFVRSGGRLVIQGCGLKLFVASGGRLVIHGCGLNCWGVPNALLFVTNVCGFSGALPGGMAEFIPVLKPALGEVFGCCVG